LNEDIIAKYLSEKGLEYITKLLDLVVIGTIMLSFCLVLLQTLWFVLLQGGQK